MSLHCLPDASRLLWAATLLLTVALPAWAAPSEGTAGQTVTSRSVQRYDSTRQAGTWVAAAPTTRPTWRELNPAQQQALSPLSTHWDRLSEERKRKWLVISKNFSSLSPAEQVKLHRRMSEWVTLSQQQRIQARQNFSEIQKLSPEQKASEWEAYQALSADEKRKLATQAPPKPAGLAAGKPGAQPKLTSVPRRASPARARLADIGTTPPYRSLEAQEERQHKDNEHSRNADEPAE
ncbi:MAG: DUF3106 domain-containing protein [Burkholderiaceae bacterium]|jgi:hypothetical protein|nr:DUF3106 domain-containing protein [Burkholderiaceae bacterium]